MSSMLEQAIVDAKALRESALKNAEQAIIEKYAPEIKEAVDSLLETQWTEGYNKGDTVKYEGKVYEVTVGSENGRVGIQMEGDKTHLVNESDVTRVNSNVLQEEEIDQELDMETGDQSIEGFPKAFNPIVDPDQKVEVEFEAEPAIYHFDLETLQAEKEAEESGSEMDDQLIPQVGTDELANELGIGGAGLDTLAGDAGGMGAPLEEDLVSEISRLLSELDAEDSNEVLEEELVVDTSQQKDGTFQTNEAILEYERDLELARQESTKYKEENEALENKMKELKENLSKFKIKNKQYKDVLEKVNEKLNETLLSNAKLLYSNITLSDASLNERQKSKIVEAIAKAKTPEEAKTLCEALSATVTSGNNKKGPRTLSESVQRRSNISGILPRRNKQVENEEHTFANHMKKLAGIK